MRDTQNSQNDIETITVYRNGVRGKTVRLTKATPQMMYYAESAALYERKSRGLSEAEASAAALDRATRYILNSAFSYLSSLYRTDKKAAFQLVEDLAESLHFSADGKRIDIRNL